MRHKATIGAKLLLFTKITESKRKIVQVELKDLLKSRPREVRYRNRDGKPIKDYVLSN